MEEYKGSANGGISAFELQEQAIVVMFNDGKTYLYDYTKPGKQHVENMKRLAVKGKGLTTYINQNIRNNYSRMIA
jgi:predicted Ser/Thr protein kinase